MKFNFNNNKTSFDDNKILQKRNFDQLLNQFNQEITHQTKLKKILFSVSIITLPIVIFVSVWFVSGTEDKYIKIETKEKQYFLNNLKQDDLKPISIKTASTNVVEETNSSFEEVGKRELKEELLNENSDIYIVEAKKMNFNYQNPNFNYITDDFPIESSSLVSVLVNSFAIQDFLNENQVKNWTKFTLKEIPDNQIKKILLTINNESVEFEGNILDGKARRLVLKAKGNDNVFIKIKYIDINGEEKDFEVNKQVLFSKSSF